MNYKNRLITFKSLGKNICVEIIIGRSFEEKNTSFVFNMTLTLVVIFLLNNIFIPLGLHSNIVKAVEKKSITVLLDPGHGGIDSGAVSKDGIMEKI